MIYIMFFTGQIKKSKQTHKRLFINNIKQIQDILQKQN